jgi:hypothetical protein
MKNPAACAIAICLVLSPSVQSAFSATWNQVNIPPQYWTSTAVSADGSHMYAVSGDTSTPWLSTDFGVTWTHDTNGPADLWHIITCSADGTQIMGVNVGGNLYISRDTASNWIQGGPYPMGSASEWAAAASSADASKYFVAEAELQGYPGLTFLSTNSGTTWDTVNIPTNYWSAGTMSANGGTLLVGAEDGAFYSSTDGGVTWNPTNFPAVSWIGFTASADGTRLAAVNAAGSIFISTNSGLVWTQPTNISPPIITTPTCIAGSANGTRLVLGVSPGTYISTNSGFSWSQDTNSPNQQTWHGLALSADGSLILAGVLKSGGGQGPLYLGHLPRLLPLNVTASAGSVSLSWLDPSNNLVLQKSSDITTTNWTTLTNVPAFDPTTLLYQVSLPKTAEPVFFRLKTP